MDGESAGIFLNKSSELTEAELPVIISCDALGCLLASLSAPNQAVDLVNKHWSGGNRPILLLLTVLLLQQPLTELILTSVLSKLSVTEICLYMENTNERNMYNKQVISIRA